MRDRAETFPIGRLKHRADFLHAAKGPRIHRDAFTLQASRPAGETGEVRIGFTLTRKVGNAVVRNRARRRLKEAVRLALGLPIEAGRDYVLVGRIDAIRMPFETLKNDLVAAFDGVHRAAAKAPRHSGVRHSGKRPSETRPAGNRPERTKRRP